MEMRASSTSRWRSIFSMLSWAQLKNSCVVRLSRYCLISFMDMPVSEKNLMTSNRYSCRSE